MRWATRLAVVAAVAGCSTRSTPNALRPAGPESSDVRTLWWTLFAIATVVFVVMMALIVASSTGKTPSGNPGGLDDGRFIGIAGVAIPFAILAGVGALTVLYAVRLRPAHGAANALTIDVTAKRWWWDIRYDGGPTGGAVGFETANEIHVPVGRPVRLTVRSDNVVHSFWVPELAGKMDAIPGQTNTIEVRANHTGRYQGVCAEFCGIQHANMAFVVVATSPEEFEAWLAAHVMAPVPSSDLARAGQQVLMSESCAGCHRITGTSAAGVIGPDLTDVGSRRTIGAGVLDNTFENMASWIRNAQLHKPGSLMPPITLTDDDLRAVTTYLEDLR